MDTDSIPSKVMEVEDDLFDAPDGTALIRKLSYSQVEPHCDNAKTNRRLAQTLATVSGHGVQESRGPFAKK